MKSRFLIILAVTCLSCEIVSAATDKVVCYHGSWSTYRSGNGQFTVSHIDPSLCTHLIYSFVGINTDGSIKYLDSTLDIDKENIVNFNAHKTSNTAVKTLIAVGGWNEGSTKYSTVAASAELRQTFIQSALDLVQNYGFDGFDLDWEYPAQRGGAAEDVQNYVTLIKEFREVFDKYGLLLTAAVAATSSSVDLSYDVPALSQYLDFINVMTYDLHGSWDGVTGQNAPLYASSIDTTANAKLLNVDSAIQGWIERGADPQKLTLGLPIYGRSFTLSDTATNGLGAATSGAGNAGPYTLEAGMLGYNEICEKQLEGGWTTVWDDEQKVPYTFKDNQWIGYDDAKSIAIKVNYAKSLNLGGVMIWSIETEDFRGICGSKYPLLNAIQSALGTANENIDDTSTEETVAEETVAEETVVVETVVEETVAEGTVVEDTAVEDTAVDDTDTSDENNVDNSSTVCTRSGYIRDPSDCTTFYYCVLVGDSYVAVSLSCQDLYFDEDTQACEWPALVSGC